MSAILIADSDAQRAHAISEACERLGMQTCTAAHGAAALELAICERPDAVVADVGLALIDGPRLAEILDANPQTREIRVLFVGDQDDEDREGDGAALPGAADPETIARFLEALLARRRRVAGDSQPPSDGGVEGDLAQIGLPELLDLLHVNRRTGVVELQQSVGRREVRGSVWLREGEIIHAAAAPVEAEKALFRLFAWRRGSFVFRPSEAAGKITVDRPARALLREGNRQLEERERLQGELPHPGARLALRVSPDSLPTALHPLTHEVLLLLEVTDGVQGILDRSTYPDYQVLRTLETLIRRGMVGVLDGPAPGPALDEDFGPGLAARVRGWLDAACPQGAPLSDAKVVVVSAAGDTSASLAGLLAHVPGVSVAPRRGNSIVAPLARISLDDEIGIELVELSADPRHAPTWRFVVHGAMAVVLLHNSAGPWRSLQPLLDLMEQHPRTRVLHLVLLDKQGTPSEAVAEPLARLDERSVVWLPQGSAREARDALGELLSRAVS